LRGGRTMFVEAANRVRNAEIGALYR